MNADLVLEGGGVKGGGLVGAVSALAEQGYEFRRVAGTSAGAIVGGLVAARMPVGDMHRVMAELDFSRFEDGGLVSRIGPYGWMAEAILHGGGYRGDVLHQWISDTLADARVHTWRDLRDDDPGSALPVEQRYRLVVIVSDVSRGRLIRLPWDYHALCGEDPDHLPVADAIRASASIPFFFRPVTLRCGAEIVREGRITLVDGGLLSNFPVAVFDRHPRSAARWPTFGIKLSARRSLAQAPWHPTDTPIEMSRELLRTLTQAHDMVYVDDPSVASRTIFVDCHGVQSTDFTLTAQTKEQLFGSGQQAGKKFLAGWDWAAWKAAYPD